MTGIFLKLSKTMVANCGIGHTYPSKVPGFIPGSTYVAQSYVYLWNVCFMESIWGSELERMENNKNRKIGPKQCRIIGQKKNKNIE